MLTAKNGNRMVEQEKEGKNDRYSLIIGAHATTCPKHPRKLRYFTFSYVLMVERSKLISVNKRLSEWIVGTLSPNNAPLENREWLRATSIGV